MAISRVIAYLGSRKNIAGCVGGLVGLGLGAAGFGGAWWWVLVLGLYAAGALAVPQARATPAPASRAPSMEPRAIRDDLVALLTHLEARSDRLPSGARDRIRETAAVLTEVIDRPGALESSPEQAYAVSRVVRSDLPTSLETFLALPKWYAGGKPTEELLAQLTLIRDDSRRLAESIYAADAQRLADHTRYLRERDRQSALEEDQGPP